MATKEVVDAMKKALDEEAMEIARDDTQVPRLRLIHRDYTALEEALDAIQHLLGVEWRQGRTRKSDERENQERGCDATHRSKCKAGKGCERCVRERHMQLDIYQRAFHGKGETGTVTVFATTVCGCGEAETTCLGCVVRIDDIVFQPAVLRVNTPGTPRRRSNARQPPQPRRSDRATPRTSRTPQRALLRQLQHEGNEGAVTTSTASSEADAREDHSHGKHESMNTMMNDATVESIAAPADSWKNKDTGNENGGGHAAGGASADDPIDLTQVEDDNVKTETIDGDGICIRGAKGNNVRAHMKMPRLSVPPTVTTHAHKPALTIHSDDVHRSKGELRENGQEQAPTQTRQRFQSASPSTTLCRQTYAPDDCSNVAEHETVVGSTTSSNSNIRLPPALSGKKRARSLQNETGDCGIDDADGPCKADDGAYMYPDKRVRLQHPAVSPSTPAHAMADRGSDAHSTDSVCHVASTQATPTREHVAANRDRSEHVASMTSPTPFELTVEDPITGVKKTIKMTL